MPSSAALPDLPLPAQPVAIIGDGQMGLVLADAFAAAGLDVRLFGPFPDHVALLARTREDPVRLPGFRLSKSVRVESDPSRATSGAVWWVNAIPTQFIGQVWSHLPPPPSGSALICVAKGLELETMRTPSDILAHVIARTSGEAGRASEVDDVARRIVVLSGPTIAAELAERRPATMVAASADPELALAAQQLFSQVPWIRVYRHDDPRGIEYAGALKNVIALAAGMVDGLNAGQNAKSALLARGLAEIVRLGTAMGARPETFFGVAGVGDLATTCFSGSGRNRTCGERLGRGELLQQILESMACVVEGVPTTRAAVALAREHNVDVPICDAVHAILYEGLLPADALRQLMNRRPTVEGL